MYDGARVMQHAYGRMIQEHPDVINRHHVNGTPKIDCMVEEAGTLNVGSLISQYIRESRVPDGLTGHIQFDSKGNRRDFTLDLMESTSTSDVQIGIWSDLSGLKVIQEPMPLPLGDDLLRNKMLKVTSVLNTPFLMNDEQGGFKGYLVDMFDKLAVQLGFEYQIHLVKDGKYGFLDSRNHWTGMIGEVIRGEADLALAPLTITASREKVIDFTRPFMSVSTTIVIKKFDSSQYRKAAQSYFFFLSAFSYDVWISLIVAYVAISLLGYGISRFTGQPDRIRSLETKHSDHLSMFSSFWFSLGSCLMRSTGVYPRSLSHRLLSIIWWIFTLIIVIIFMASVTSLLIVDKKAGSAPSYMRDVHKTMEHSLKTDTPKIGLISGGSTANFFKDSMHPLYKKFGDHVNKNPQLATTSYSEGIRRVRESDNYAFIMESSSAEYITHQDCDLQMIPGSFYSSGYAIAVKQDSPMRETLSASLIQLEESGFMSILYNKWWKEDSMCIDSDDSFVDSYYGHLTLTEMAGVFTILIVGAIVGVISAVAEYFLRSRHSRINKERRQPKSGSV